MMSSFSKQNLFVFTCGIVLGSWIHHLIISRRRSLQLQRIELSLEKLSNLIEQKSDNNRSTFHQSSKQTDNIRDNDNSQFCSRAQSPFNEQYFDTQDSFVYEQTQNVNNSIDFKQLDVRLEDLHADFAKIEKELSNFIPQYSSESEFWWRLAKVKYMLAKSEQFSNDKNARKLKFEEANECAKRSLELNEESAEAHKWAAITIGSLADYVSLRERISNGLSFHHHLDAAMERKKDDPTLYHLMGRFIIEIVSLSWIEKKLVSTFVDELPNVDNNKAIEFFYEADRIKPKWRENLFYLSKTLVADNRKDEARIVVKRCLELGEGITFEEKEIYSKICAIHSQLS